MTRCGNRAVHWKEVLVDSVVSKLQETGEHVAKAGKTFLDEVRDAGRGLAVLVRSEAKGWRRFLTQRSSRLKGDAGALFTTSAIERELLSRVDGTLRSLDTRVRERLASLEKRTTRPAARKANGKRRARRSGAV